MQASKCQDIFMTLQSQRGQVGVNDVRTWTPLACSVNWRSSTLSGTCWYYHYFSAWGCSTRSGMESEWYIIGTALRPSSDFWATQQKFYRHNVKTLQDLNLKFHDPPYSHYCWQSQRETWKSYCDLYNLQRELFPAVIERRDFNAIIVSQIKRSFLKVFWRQNACT